MGRRYLYCHGFASGPSSRKGVALARHFAARGAKLELLDLRVPSFERLRFSEIVAAVRAALGGPEERVVLLGSSLGGLASARVAALDPRVASVVLLAPAFRLADRWRARLAGEELARWESTGWLDVWDHASAAPGRVDFGFLLDLEAADPGWPDVRVPTLIIHGRRDETVDVETSRQWARGKRHVRLVEADDGHELVESIPLIEREVDRFLSPFLGARP